jgi:hypothetical protein
MQQFSVAHYDGINLLNDSLPYILGYKAGIFPWKIALKVEDSSLKCDLQGLIF